MFPICANTPFSGKVYIASLYKFFSSSAKKYSCIYNPVSFTHIGHMGLSSKSATSLVDQILQ